MLFYRRIIEQLHNITNTAIIIVIATITTTYVLARARKKDARFHEGAVVGVS